MEDYKAYLLRRNFVDMGRPTKRREAAANPGGGGGGSSTEQTATSSGAGTGGGGNGDGGFFRFFRTEKRGRKPGSGRPRRSRPPIQQQKGNGGEEREQSPSRSASPSRSQQSSASVMAECSSSSSSRAGGPGRRAGTRSSTRLLKLAEAERNSGLDAGRSARLARYFEKHPEQREEYARYLMVERPAHQRGQPTVTEHESVYHDGTIFTVGDIVSITDTVDGAPYFAQIRALLSDSATKKHAALTWLVPKRSALNAHVFDPAHFGHAIVDGKNYPIECLSWVSERPAMPAYMTEVTPAVIAARSRIADVRRRRDALIRATKYELCHQNAELMKAGDVKEIHEQKNEKLLEQVLKAEPTEQKEESDEAGGATKDDSKTTKMEEE